MAQFSSKFKTDIMVVGAGICGLLAAKTLTSSGYRVSVVDKGRGVGGRLATRRIDGAVFDHGAQYFTTRDPVFSAIVQDWEKEGIIRPWATGFRLQDGSLKQDGQQRFFGTTGMTSIAKHLARGLDVRLGTRIIRVACEDGGWSLATDLGDIFMGRALLLTPPVPQSLALFADGKVILPESMKKELEQVEYAPCLALLVSLSGSSLIPAPGGLWLSGEPISWIADNHQKGISPALPATLTIHAGPNYSRENWKTPEEKVTQELLDAASAWLGSTPGCTQLHRWRYSIPTKIHHERCVSVAHPAPVVFAGDAFGGPRIEGAALSGLAAAGSLVEMLSRQQMG
jgi:predicted NAD/FAD-dependent oxidoreductase